jgi:hypothetical protein
MAWSRFLKYAFIKAKVVVPYRKEMLVFMIAAVYVNAELGLASAGINHPGYT